jgi:predicted DNA-binding transcriptional regulator AlpA
MRMSVGSRSTIYLSTPQVLARYGGISEMTLWRWMKNDDFPSPRWIHNRRYWVESECDAWDEKNLRPVPPHDRAKPPRRKRRNSDGAPEPEAA